MQNRLVERVAGNVGHYPTLPRRTDRHLECQETEREDNKGIFLQ